MQSTARGQTGVILKSLIFIAAGVCVAGSAPAQEEQPVSEVTLATPGPSLISSFLGEFYGTAAHRDSVRLNTGSASGQSLRATFNLQWRLQRPRIGLRAVLSPYFEQFSEGDLSTYGGSAGLTLTHQRSPTVMWNVRATVMATPEQDVAPPQLEDQPSAPAFSTLVPRNGFVATTAGIGVTKDLSEVSSVSANAGLSSTKYDAFNVDDANPRPSLSDEETIAVSTGYGHALSALRAWNVTAAIQRKSLSGGEQLPEDGGADRDQMSVKAGISQRFRTQSIVAEAGFSRTDSGSIGSEAAFVFDGTWNWAGKRSGSSVAVRRSQGVFAGERVSTDRTSIVSTLNWQLPRRSTVNLSGVYGVSERSSGGAGDVRTSGVTAGYRWQGHLLGWSAALSSRRQRTDADFGTDQDTTSFTVSLIWRFAGGAGSV